MRCAKCGKELESGVLFCPFCGEKVRSGAPGEEPLLYQTEVKGLLKSGQLLVYGDRAEFVMSKVQKMVFRYESLVAVRKGLDRINFVMEDGRTEACAVNRKSIHEAYYIIDQAVKPYLARRSLRLREEGVRFSFPSSPSGLGGMLSGGLLNILDDRCEYIAPNGKNETVSYRDVKAVRVSPVGALEFTLYDGTRKAFTADRELRDEAVSFLQTALLPFQEERRQALLAQGIYFSFLNNQGFNRGVLNIYDSRMEYRAEAGQTDTVQFREIRAFRAYDTSLELGLTNGTTKTFVIDREAQSQVSAFLEEAIAPYVEERTKGFDTVFGQKEKLEINGDRGVFHIIRQGGREISDEYALADVVKAEAVETKASRDLVSALFARNGDPTPKSTEDRIVDVGVLLTVRTGQGTGNIPVCFGSLAYGAGRTSAEYERYGSEQDRFFAYLEQACPGCELVLPVPEEEPEVPGIPAGPQEAGPREDNASPAPESGGQETGAPAAGALEKGQFGTLVDGIVDFVENCGTPMTVAIQGDWETGSGSFIRMIYDSLEESRRGSAFWLYTWQFSQFDLGEQLPMLLADKLIELLGGAVNEEAKVRAKMLAQGMIGIASGLISQGTSDGQKLTDALFRDNLASSLEQKVRLFGDLVRRRAAGGNGKVILFIDDLNRLAPAKVTGLLEAMRAFFDCPGCVFMAAVDRETVIRGKQELEGPEYSEEKGDAYFDKLFKMAFRVPKSSFNIEKYIVDNLGRVRIATGGEEEIRHFGRLAALSLGRDPKGLERLFNSFLLLKSLAGEEMFSVRESRLALFALLCMQSRFPGAYSFLVRQKERITPEFLTSLADGSCPEELAGPGEAEKQSFCLFMEELCACLREEGAGAPSGEDCRRFAEALAVSAVVSLR